jgi:hypothetical protein
MAKKPTPPKPAVAVLTLRGVADMHADTRQDMATWIRGQATQLIKKGMDYTPGFHGRFYPLDKPQETGAFLTIRQAAKWTPAGRRMIAEWLRKQARALLKHGDDYAKRFRARYMPI